MAKEPKSPQQKKKLEFEKDHFTFSNAPHGFSKLWRQKKARANRQYRRKSEKLLAPAKPQVSCDDAETILGDLTVAQLRKSVTRKRLRKQGTVSVREKIQIKLENRKDSIGRRVNKHRESNEVVTQAVGTLTSLGREDLTNFLKRAMRFIHGGDPIEWMRVSQSHVPLDRALYFLEGLQRGNVHFREALCRNQKLCEAMQQWQEKANRILRREARPALRKVEEKRSLKRNVNASRRSSRNQSEQLSE